MRNNREISFSVPSIFSAKSITLVFLLFLGQGALGQFSDNFSDGDFTATPNWSGTGNVFNINTSQQLQLNNTVAGTSFLSVPFLLADLNELNWEFYVKQTLAPSSSNFGRVYLVSDQANLTGALNGYFIQFGEAGTLDAVELFRQTGTTLTSVCRAMNGKIANSFSLRIKISRDNAGLWKLLIDYSGGTNFVEEASGTDISHTSSSFLGVLCVYTASFAKNFFYDDFLINPFVIPDTAPPVIQSVTVNSANELMIVFSETVDVVTAEMVDNYSVLNGIGVPASVSLQPDNKTVKLFFNQDFPNGIENKITVAGIKDQVGNTMPLAEKTFLYFNPVPPQANDIIINEIFADPSPSVGLPEIEFLELLNRSQNPFNVSGWKITDGTSTGVFSSLILLPGEYLILAPASSANLYTAYGRVMGLTIFPSLNNAGDAMMLSDAAGLVISAVKYSSSWYRDVDKENGGYTLERIDPEDFCKDSENWRASNGPIGGSPGAQNSVFAIIPDTEGPKVISCKATDAKTIELDFNEKLSASLPSSSDFSISPQLTIASITYSDAFLKKLKIAFIEEIALTKAYTIESTNIFDCAGNLIQTDFSKALLKLDNTAPFITALKVVSKNELQITFSEAIQADAVINKENYVTVYNATPIEIINEGENVYVVRFSSEFVNGTVNALTLFNMNDVAGNPLKDVSREFMYFVEDPSHFKDIVINEIFADPTPTIALPEAEFIELYNRSANPFDLNGWKISDDGQAVSLSSKIILPDEYVIICSNTQTSKFTSYGNVIGVSGFPSLNNTADFLVLKNRDGTLIDSLHYDISWYNDDAKKDGGWTIELIYAENICAEKENWISSEDISGGTPGKQNSVAEEKPDLTGPKLISGIALNETQLVLTFNEKLDATTPSAANFSTAPIAPIQEVSFQDNTRASILIEFSEALKGGVRYELKIGNIFDCPGNSIDSDHNAITFSLPEPGDILDIIVNEILFNPRTTGTDFIEVYNRSAKYINLKGWQVANLVDGEPANHKLISNEDFLIAPESYMVFTEDMNILKGEYLNRAENNFVEIDIPGMADDEGSVVLISNDGNIIDAVSYSDDFHSVFIRDNEGISLERLSFSASSSAPDNWKSASTSVFATPGYQNSNASSEMISGDETISIHPEVFLPMEGQPNFATINYKLDKPGYVGNVRIFDPVGNVIKEVVKSELLSAEGFFRWEGDRDDGSKARVGPYMVYVELFDETGIVRTFRKRVVVAAKF
jgi:hypothetical protein